MIGVHATPIEGRVGDIQATVRKMSKRIVSRMAAYTRKTEINSMLKAPAGAYSAPGTPPHTHPRTSKKGNTLPAFPQFIRFATFGNDSDPRAVVGPTKPSTGRRGNWAERIGRTHEFGGTVTVEKRVVYKKGRPTGLVLWRKNKQQTFPFTIKSEKEGRGGRKIFLISYRATYPKRPFAAPALGKTIAASKQGKFIK